MSTYLFYFDFASAYNETCPLIIPPDPAIDCVGYLAGVGTEHAQPKIA